MNPETNIYTTLEEAKEEVWKRWNNEALRREVELFVGDIPEPLRKEPRAWLDRFIATPDNEFLEFLSLADQIELKPLFIESLEDRFYRKNEDKLTLGIMSFLGNGSSDKAGENVRPLRIINDRQAHMKRFKEIKTLWDEGLIDFHHRLFSLYAPPVEVYDASSWFQAKGPKAKEYYPYLLALFVCHGVLFENFITDVYELAFLEEVAHPALQKVTREFGLKPLIVPLAPEEDVKRIYWWCYPDFIEAEVERCLLEERKNGNRIQNKQPH